MKSENTKEYELIRQEMISVKECMTRYIGFVLGGTGVAIYAILTMVHSQVRLLEVAFTCFVLSIIMSFVLLILFYKFFSHNRFAGYCKLLNHENYDTTDSGETRDLFAWEICVGRLRASDIRPEFLLGLIDESIKIKNINKKRLYSVLERYVGRTPVIDRCRFVKGFKILFLAIIGIIKTRSWGFPPMVVAIFFIIVFGFLSGGIYTTINIFLGANVKSLDNNIMYFFAVLVLLAQLVLWWRFIGKLYSLMIGSATVDAFFLRFLPVRAFFLNKYNKVPEYFDVDERLKEAVKEWEKEKRNDSSEPTF